MKNRKKRNKIYLLVILVLVVSIGYALLSTTLNINGIAGIKKNTWDIHWDEESIQVTENSVSSETPTVTEEGQKVSYAVTLELPGDFYEFTIDAVNAGTIDGMVNIDGLTPTIKNKTTGEVTTLPSYIKYSVTYADGSPIEEFHKLAKRVDEDTPTREKFKIRIEYDSQSSELPDDDKEFEIDDDLPYIPDDGRGKDRNRSGTATLAAGPIVNAKLKQLAGNTNITSEKVEQVSYLYKILFDYHYNQSELPDEMTEEELMNTLMALLNEVSNSNIISIVYSPTLPSEYENDSNLISDETSIKPVYAWYDNGTIYIYSDENTIYMNNNSSDLFSTFVGLNNIDLSRFNTSNATNMGNMFLFVQAVQKLDLSGFEINSNANMEDIFFLFEVEELNLSNWNFSKYNSGYLMSNFGLNKYWNVSKLIMDNTILPENMSYAFYDIDNLQEISLKNADSSNVTNMSAMFAACGDLTKIDLSNFDTTNVTDMSNMFNNSPKIKELDLSSFNTNKVTNMFNIFYGSNIEELNLNNWNFSQYNPGSLTENLGLMRSNKIKVLTLDNAILPSNMNNGFNHLTKLENISFKNVDTSRVTDMSYMFNNCEKLKELDLSSFNTSRVTDMSYMFNYCKDLLLLNVSSFNTDNVIDMEYMFGNCKVLSSLNVSNFNTRKVTDMSWMFYYCSSLPSLNVSSFDTSNVTNMRAMFCGLFAITTLDLDNFNTDNVTDMAAMFGDLSSITTLDLDNFNTSKVTDMAAMFTACSNLHSLNLSKFDTSKVTNMQSMFSDCTNLVNINLNSFDTSKVTDMAAMFKSCTSLENIDLSSFYTPKLESIEKMFYDCTNLVTIYVSDGWTRQSIQESRSEDVFTNCYNLVGGNGTIYSSDNENDWTYAKIDPYDESQGIYIYGYFTYKAVPIINNTGSARKVLDKLFS